MIAIPAPTAPSAKARAMTARLHAVVMVVLAKG